MRELSTFEIVVGLLESLRDARDSFTTGNGGGAGPGFPCMGPLYSGGSYRRLEEQLIELKRWRPQLWWHTVGWYCCDYRLVDRERRVRAGGGSVKVVLREREPVRVNGVDRTLADRGVEWLCVRMLGLGGAWLPRELLERLAA